MALKFRENILGKRIALKRTRPLIKTAEIIFRTVAENRSHLEPWFEWAKHTLKTEDTLKYLFEKEEKLADGGAVEYAIYKGKDYIGNISIFDIDLKNRSAEIGYWLSSSFTGEGYMTEAVGLLEDYAFKKFNINRIRILCDSGNKASSSVAQRCGYVLEGELRELKFSRHFNSFRNFLVYSKLSSEHKKNLKNKKQKIKPFS